jgi:hypothetical protein
MRQVSFPSLAALIGSVACTTLQPVSDPARYIAEVHPKVLYVTHASGAVVAVAQPRVSGDSLVGTREGLTSPVAVPLTEVERVEAMQRDKKRTTLVVVGLTTVTVMVGTLLAINSLGTEGETCDYTYKGCPQ